MKKSYWIALAISGAALLILIIIGSSLFGGWNYRGWGMMGDWPGGLMHGYGFGSFGWLGMILMWLIPLGLILLVVMGVVGLVRGFSPTDKGEVIQNVREEPQPSPREILQMRYASGEITREQYLQILDDLQ